MIRTDQTHARGEARERPSGEFLLNGARAAYRRRLLVDAQTAARLFRPFQTVTGAPRFRPDPTALGHIPSIALMQHACRIGFRMSRRELRRAGIAFGGIGN